jgi:peroxiredoxin
MRLNPHHAEAASRLALLKAPSAPRPAQPAVSPFVYHAQAGGEQEPALVTPDWGRQEPAPPAAAPGEHPAEPPPPERPAQVPPRKAPRRRTSWVFDALLIGSVVCLVGGAIGSVVLNRRKESQQAAVAQTQAVADALEQARLQTLPPTWTPTDTRTPFPTRTQAPSVTPSMTPTITLTAQFTPSYTPLPLGAVVGPGMTQFAPDFSLQTADRRQVVRLGEYIGQPILIFFWATWCPYCREEIPDLVQLTDRYRSRGLVVLAVNAHEPAATVLAYAQDMHLNFSVLLDPDSLVQDLYGVQAIPRNFFINPAGRITAVVEGAMDYDQLEARVISLLVGYAPPTP